MPSILVVDDETGMREALTRLLAAQGHAALSARSAEEALDLLGVVSDIPVIVADLQMPGHGGAWLVEQLGRLFPNIAIVLATADDAVPGTLSLQSPVVGYLVKPFSGEQLAAAIAQGLRWREQRLQQPANHVVAASIDSWLDTKLTRGRSDDSNSEEN